ncbi:MAG: C2H2-type zinc finger protein [Candidatus Nitrosocosmicus sp.]
MDGYGLGISLNLQLFLIVMLKQMSNIESNGNNKGYTQSDSQPNNDSGTVYCRICNQEFNDMAEMQRHVMTEHMDKGEIPED